MITEPRRCSVGSLAAGEQPGGTAPHARSWVLVEQEGPWGHAAVRESRLSAGPAERLLAAAAAARVRVGLIRQVGGRPDPTHTTRRVFVASTTPGSARLVRLELGDPDELDELDLPAIAAGRLPTGTPVPEGLLAVCTNGRRDLCCALDGRRLATEVAGLLGEIAPGLPAVWETSHLGGHRFAPTGVLLPSGVVLGRLDAESAVRAWRAASAGQLPTGLLGAYRGRSTFPAAGQVAEATVRTQAGVEGLDDLMVHPATEEGLPTRDDRWQVRHRDGRAWTVRARPVASEQFRPASCATVDSAVTRWETGVGPVGRGGEPLVRGGTPTSSVERVLNVASGREVEPSAG
ncbi:MAG: sucrase ferredoxin [Actinomycetes bacterium]